MFQHPQGQYHGLPYQEVGENQPSLRQRSAVACRYCRKRKIRCFGSDTAVDGRCTSCVRFNQECVFVPASARDQILIPAHTLYPHLRNTQSPPQQSSYQMSSPGQTPQFYGPQGQRYDSQHFYPPREHPQQYPKPPVGPPSGSQGYPPYSSTRPSDHPQDPSRYQPLSQAQLSSQSHSHDYFHNAFSGHAPPPPPQSHYQYQQPHSGSTTPALPYPSQPQSQPPSSRERPQPQASSYSQSEPNIHLPPILATPSETSYPPTPPVVPPIALERTSSAAYSPTESQSQRAGPLRSNADSSMLDALNRRGLKQ